MSLVASPLSYSPLRCPLCHGYRLAVYHTATQGVPWRLYSPDTLVGEGLRFFRCKECALVVKDPAVRATPQQERAHYEKHNNDLADSGYREHLLRLISPMLPFLVAGAEGLDYGCGPALSIEPLMTERGMRCASYDPLFFPSDERVSLDRYDFITCCEVPEHFKDPRREYERLRGMLKRGGILGVMTRLVPESFESWWYHRDPTHVVFYSEATLSWIGTHFGFTILEQRGDVAVLRRE